MTCDHDVCPECNRDWGKPVLLSEWQQQQALIESLRFQLEQTESALRAAQQDAKAAWGAARSCDKEIARLREIIDSSNTKDQK